jgi:membrane protease YdiL (CAAX protease family)
LLQLIASLTAPKSLSHQRALLVGSLAPGRPWIDLSFQLLSIAVVVAPVALVAYLMVRSGESLATLGVDGRRPLQDLARGAVLAAVVGGCGLALYLGAYHAGVNLTVVPASLPPVWWRIPVLILSAAQDGVLEEILVVGYLLHRLSQLGWGPKRSLVTSALLRGSYHLYQGFGGFAGNVVMGLLFGRLYQRWGRTTPLIIAHTLIDAVTFVGYTLLHRHVSWLP